MLHTNSSCCRVKNAKEDWKGNAFSSHHGLFDFICLPFGIINTSGTFHRAMDALLT